MDVDESEAALHHLLVASLSDFGNLDGEAWTGAIERLCSAILDLGGDTNGTLADVVRAEVVINEFLLALAAGRPGQPTRAELIDAVRQLLATMHDDRESTDDLRSDLLQVVS